jgi:hypothetical protein
MDEREEEAPSRQRRIKKAKSFGLRIFTFIFGLLFLCSIALCVLFATGIIEIEDSEDGTHFVFVSPLADNNQELAPADPKQGVLDDGASQNLAPTATNESFAAYDFKIDELLSSAKTIFPDSEIYVFDLRATTNGDYLIAALRISTGNFADAKYYYRPVAKDGEWKLIKAMGSQAAPLCEDMSDLERKLIRESYPEKNSCQHEDGSFESL